MKPKHISRYPRVLVYLMALLAVLGFAVAAIGSRKLLVVYAVVYLMVFIAWAVPANGTEHKE